MIYPLDQFYRITSRFGFRIHPITGEGNSHSGIDIAVPVGTQIYAPEDGYVKKSYENAIGGKQMIIAHPNGYDTGYAHLSTQLPEGTKVKKGDKIALTGNTGRSTGPHLHFTLRKDGRRIDPESYKWKLKSELGIINSADFKKTAKFTIPLIGLIVLSVMIYKSKDK